MKTILFVDGENFKNKIYSILLQEKLIGQINISQIPWDRYNFQDLFNKTLKGILPDEVNFYFGKLSQHPETLKKSKELIEKNRLLKKHLENFNYNVIIAGRVRGFSQEINGKKVWLFKEKGVDVKLAVDLVTLVCDHELDLAIVASSDSDLQPAIREIIQRGAKCIYLGFENDPNKGLIYTTNRAILIRNSEVREFFRA